MYSELQKGRKPRLDFSFTAATSPMFFLARTAEIASYMGHVYLAYMSSNV